MQIVTEGGNATAKWNTQRATQRDIQLATEFVAKVLNMPLQQVRDQLLGSTEMTLLGYRDDSGDIDIAMDQTNFDMQEVHDKMLAELNGEGTLFPGFKVGSYAVPTSDGKKVQVDLMYTDPKWAKFIFHSDQGRDTPYKGLVRNTILMAMARHVLKPGDVVVKDPDTGQIIAVARYGLNVGHGLKRQYKIAQIGKNGQRKKTLTDVTPQELIAFLKQYSPEYENVRINTAQEAVTSPEAVIKYLFDEDIAPHNLRTAEQVLTFLSKTDKITPQQKSIIAMDALTTLQKEGVEYPPELEALAHII